ALGKCGSIRVNGRDQLHVRVGRRQHEEIVVATAAGVGRQLEGVRAPEIEPHQIAHTVTQGDPGISLPAPGVAEAEGAQSGERLAAGAPTVRDLREGGTAGGCAKSHARINVERSRWEGPGVVHTVGESTGRAEPVEISI